MVAQCTRARARVCVGGTGPPALLEEDAHTAHALAGRDVVDDADRMACEGACGDAWHRAGGFDRAGARTPTVH